MHSAMRLRPRSTVQSQTVSGARIHWQCETYSVSLKEERRLDGLSVRTSGLEASQTAFLQQSPRDN